MRGASLNNASLVGQQAIDRINTINNLSQSGIYQSISSSNNAAKYVSSAFSAQTDTKQDLLNQIEQQMRPSKTLIRQTEVQRQRLMQSHSRSQYASRQLQIDLNKKGVTQNQTLNITDECRQTLKEISFINEQLGKTQTFEHDMRKSTLPPADLYFDAPDQHNLKEVQRECAWRVYDSRVKFMDKLGQQGSTKPEQVLPGESSMHAKRGKSTGSQIKHAIDSAFMST